MGCEGRVTDDDPVCPSTSVILIQPTRLRASSSLTAPLPGALQLLTSFSVFLQMLIPLLFNLLALFFVFPAGLLSAPFILEHFLVI